MRRTLIDHKVSGALPDCFATPATLNWQTHFKHAFINRLLILIGSLFFYSAIFAQTTTTFPSAGSCTSKDLELVGAAITSGDPCNACEPNTTVTRTLTLSINNSTKSTRTSFAFWGTLERTAADGTVTTSPISGCGGPIVKGIVNHLNYGQVTYVCGDAIKIKNLFLAWTDASDKSDCASINSALINPKCGTLPEITVNAGLNGNLSQTNLSCFGASNGSISMTTFGGAGPYTFSWSASGGGVVPASQATNEDLTGLVAGTYTVVITDSKNCTITRSRTITGPAAGLTLGTCTKSDVTCFGGNNGSVTAGAVSNQVGTPQYSWKNASNVVVSTSASATGLSAGTYTLTVTDNCSSRTCSVTIGSPSAGLSLGTCSKTNVSCAGGDGSVSAGTVTNAVGTVVYSWKNASDVQVGNTANVSNLSAGTYTLTVTDNCSSRTCSVTVGAPASITSPVATVSEQPTCATGAGIVAITNPGVNNIYTLVQGGTVKYTAAAGIFNGVIPGTYSVVGSTGICSANGNNVTVNQQPSTPPTPYVAITKHPDCSSAEGTLQVKLNATTNYSSNYEFSSDGVNYVDGNEFSFIAGQGYEVYVRTKGTTCVASASCQGQTAARPSQSTNTSVQLSPVRLPVLDIVQSELKVQAYPNPFNQKINFVVSSPVSGKGSLEVYNGMGQKVKTVYTGMISRGNQTFELTLPAHKTSNLLYVLRVGNQRISGKILQLNR